MWPDSPFAKPVSSFERPVPLILIPPDSEPYMYVRFNRAWLPYILGSLKQLMLQTTWQTDDPATLNTQQEYAGQILYEFMIGKNTAPDVTSVGADEGCNLIRQNPDNPCLLETSIDGTNWCAFADLGKCFDAATGQPGSDSRQPLPGGGCESYALKLQANSQVLVPTVVNAGDVVSFSDIKGAGGDGTLHWYCPNGSIFFAGACVGSFSFDGADPAPAIHHMAVLAKIGSVYYDVTAGPITVPGGITNEQIVLQVNDSVLTDNGGEYSLSAEVCNNQSAEWTSVMQFALSPYAFAVVPADGGGVWTAAAGWDAQDTTIGGNCYKSVAIKKIFTAATLTSIKFEAAIALGTASGSVSQQIVRYAPARTVMQTVANSAGADVPILWTGSQLTDNFELNGAVGFVAGACGAAGGSERVFKLTVTGTGPKPPEFP